jgi:hypothetical protein
MVSTVDHQWFRRRKFMKRRPRPGHGELGKLLWKITISEFCWSNGCITRCSDEWSGGASGEASTTTDGVRNGCGDNCPVLRTPFIRRRWCMAGKLRIESTVTWYCSQARSETDAARNQRLKQERELEKRIWANKTVMNKTERRIT